MLEKRRRIQKNRRTSDVKIRSLLRGSSLAATASIARRLRDRLEERLVHR
jgi:hypothetical protein